MRHTRPIATTTLRGLQVATVEETLLTCARDLALLDLVVLGDAALHSGATTHGALEATAGRRRWGAAALGRALGWMDGRSESPWESLLRVLHRLCGIAVQPQHEVVDQCGRFVARGDLWIVGSRMLHEYDGGGHRDRETHLRDLDRDRRLLSAGWHRRGYTSRDLLHRPELVLREADETLGRRHRVDRLDPWLRVHEESLFHPAGREALAVRLRLPGSGRSRQRHAG
jgi:very-short-patch-repair endonuclease